MESPQTPEPTPDELTQAQRDLRFCATDAKRAGLAAELEDLTARVMNSALAPLVLPKQRTTCGKCRFWCTENGQEGACRRYAPRAIAGVGRDSFWLTTLHNDWCGEGEYAHG